MPRATELKPDFSAACGKRLLIALSGGADSVALAALLAEARSEYDLTLFAAHLDHGIRPESADDAAFCAELCRKLEIPLTCARLEIREEAARLHMGLETLARMRRYEFLQAQRQQTGADFIALAHHMDDQAETVLMHLGRGAGPGGVCGMRELSGDLYRPLLGFRKAELQAYVKSRGLSWREDATNAVADTPRNALRLHALPALEQCYPRFVPALTRYARAAQIENDYLDELTREFLEIRGGGNPFCRWIDLDPPPERALLRRALMKACPVSLDFETVNALEALCGQLRGKLDLGKTHLAERCGIRLYFVPKRLPAIPEVALKLDGATRFEPLCRIEAAPCDPVPIRDDPTTQALNAKPLRGAVIRLRRPGDRIRPLGGGDKLLSDYFTDKKLDRPLRDAVPLIARENRVLWACGVGISQEAALIPGCRAVKLKCIIL